jgi:hypothetical protein
VLKRFGREKSYYAQSSEKDITNAVVGSLRGKTDRKGKTSNQLDMRYLLDVAKQYTSDHMASISYNGKWVSFRHAGGDYLKDYTSIFNVVGRFVRAMIIASDPTLYAQEYKTALAKMVQPTPQSSSVNSLRETGVQTIELSIHRSKPNVNFLICIKKLISGQRGRGSSSMGFDITPNSVAAQDNLLTGLSGEGSRIMYDKTIERLEKGDLSNCATVLLIPSTYADLQAIVKFKEEHTGVGELYGSGYTLQGLFVGREVTLPANDPRVANLILNIRKSRFKK